MKKFVILITSMQSAFSAASTTAVEYDNIADAEEAVVNLEAYINRKKPKTVTLEYLRLYNIPATTKGAING